MWSPLPHQRRSTTRIPAKLVRFDLSSFFLFLVLCMIFFFKNHIYVEVKKKMPRLNVELAQSGQSNASGEMTVVDVVFKRLEGTLCAIVL